MRVEILERREPDQIEIDIHNPLPGVPDWILIEPNSNEQKFWTNPPEHPLEGIDGGSGSPAVLLIVARRLLADDIGKDEAERVFRSALTEWSNLGPAT